MESSVYDPDASLYTLVELGDDIPNNYTAETCRDEEGVIIAQIIYDNHDRIVLFALYPDSGGTVVISTSYDSQGTIISNTLMMLDEDGNITETADMLAQETADYTDYNDYSSDSSAITVAQMESLDGGGMMLMSSTPEAPASAAEIFNYDHLGNRYQYTNKYGYVTTYTHNPINQYSRSVMALPYVGEVEVTPLYDDNGNLSADGEGYTYLYDYQNRLTEIEEVVQFKYDALGRRFYKKDLTTNAETYYFFDTNNRIIAQYVKPQNETAELDRSFVYGNGPHEVLAMFLPENEGSSEDWQEFLSFCEAWLAEPNDANWNNSFDVVDDDCINLKDYAYYASQWNLPPSGETEWYYLHDAQGSVMGLVGGRLNRTEDQEFYTYDVYGTPSGTSAIGNPFMFHGKFVASTTPLIYSRFWRDYTPSLARWLQIDPKGYIDGMNLYEFVKSNPINNIDLLGSHTDFNPNGPKPKSIPKTGKRWDFSGFSSDSMHMTLYGHFLRPFHYTTDGRSAEFAILGGQFLWAVRGQSELEQYEKDVRKQLERDARIMLPSLPLNGRDTFADRGSQLITADYSSTNVRLSLQGFTVYWDASCDIGPKRLCSNNQCTGGCAVEARWNCSIDWTLYDYYDFAWYDFIYGWIGTPYHIYGFWNTGASGKVNSCE